MEAVLKVKVLTSSPDFEENIVRAAKVCYSSDNIDALGIKVEGSNNSEFLKKLISSGHYSVLEHSVITFGIEGISRALSHQLYR